MFLFFAHGRSVFVCAGNPRGPPLHGFAVSGEEGALACSRVAGSRQVVLLACFVRRQGEPQLEGLGRCLQYGHGTLRQRRPVFQAKPTTGSSVQVGVCPQRVDVAIVENVRVGLSAMVREPAGTVLVPLRGRGEEAFCQVGAISVAADTGVGSAGIELGLRRQRRFCLAGHCIADAVL